MSEFGERLVRLTRTEGSHFEPFRRREHFDLLVNNMVKCLKGMLRGLVLKSKLVGRPDIVFIKAHVAVIVDGDFWHGKDIDECANQVVEVVSTPQTRV